MALWARRDAPELPADLPGNLVYVSDRSGIDTLYLRRLPARDDVRLTWLQEPVSDPAVSPDGARAAYAVAGRIEIVHLTTGDTLSASLGIGQRDAQPAWRPDGRALVVVSRAGEGERADLYLLELMPDAGLARRTPLTRTPQLDESDPVFSPDAASIVFACQGGLHELDLASGTARRLTTGFREAHGARFLPDGDLVCLWREDKRFGIDRLGRDGSRTTLHEGAAAYRRLAPSPDGAYLVASLGLDLGFHLSELLKPRPTQQLHLLAADGRLLGPLVSSWGHSNHSGDWGLR